MGEARDIDGARPGCDDITTRLDDIDYVTGLGYRRQTAKDHNRCQQELDTTSKLEHDSYILAPESRSVYLSMSQRRPFQ